ncbi:CPK33 [Symbiodinium sp. CCMP2456]|nr:CPK33 [Symbiodinium sp. CCMP2456]
MYRQCLCLPHDDAQDASLATICALVQQPDPLTLLRVERLRYARQLIANGPDILWALLRPNAQFMTCMQDAFWWLHSWVANTTELGKPDVSWDDWHDLIVRRPGRFKGIVKRARALECVRVAAFANLQAFRKALLARAGVQEGPDRTGEDRPAAYTEACLVCKVAFPTRATWAVHAAKCHGYRAPATLLAKEQEQPLCAGCGKLFANAHRLRRHLLHAGGCRTRWGTFVVDGAIPAIPHSQRPPLQVSGASARAEDSYDPVQVHPGLLAQLLDLASPCPEDVWEIVVEYVEPLAILKSTLQSWARHPHATDQVREVAADTELMLDPELWCEDFRSARRGCGAPAACRDLLPVSVCAVDFRVDGVLATFRLEEPPLPQFVYPFQTSVPLAAAKRHLLWLGAAVDTVNHFLAASVRVPVVLSAPPRALLCLQPARKSIANFAQMSFFSKAALNCVAAQLDTHKIENLAEAFAGYDADHDGRLSTAEFAAGLAEMGVDVDVIDQLVASVDMDCDGHINYTEFVAALLQVQGKLIDDVVYHAFQIFDLNGDGHISLDELRSMLSGGGPLSAVLPDGKTVEQALQDLDTSQDGVVSFDEFKAYLTRESQGASQNKSPEDSIEVDVRQSLDVVLQQLASLVGRPEAELLRQSKRLAQEHWITTDKGIRSV